MRLARRDLWYSIQWKLNKIAHTMFRTIVHPTDFSNLSFEAFAHASRMALSRGLALLTGSILRSRPATEAGSRVSHTIFAVGQIYSGDPTSKWV
jgi:hypothetical protein